MTADEISRMDYKQLRNAVIELNDSYIRLKRLVEDSLDNIDESNLATTFRKKINGYESQFTIAANKISSKVEHIEGSLKQYSTIEQTADKIEMAVNESREYTDGQTQQLSSTFTMTAGQISTNVVKVNNRVDSSYTDLYSKITQTAENIVTEVGKTYNKSRYFESGTMPPRKTTDGYDEDILCRYNGEFYYYNTITNTWNPYNGTVKSAMIQTQNGFEFTSNVKISGDLITEGTISGVDYTDTNHLGVLRLSSTSNKYADMIYTRVKDGRTLFRVYEGAEGGYVSLTVCGNTIGHGNSSKFYPEGTWDFSNCNVKLPTE